MSMLGVILAGGLSTRMGGGDKSLLPLAGKPLLAHVMDRLLPQVDQMVLNANGDLDRFKGFGLPVVADSIDDFAGPLAGILAGMDYAHAHGFQRILVVAADTPFFPRDLSYWLFEGCYKINIAKTANDSDRHNLHPTFGLWDVDLRDDLRAALKSDMRKVMGFVKQQDWRSVEWADQGYDPFFNVNTPEDMAQAEQMIQDFKT